MAEPVHTEPATRSTALGPVLEPIVAAAMRGHYELLLAEAERAVVRLFPGTQARVLMHLGGSWRD